jgi:hypothetical protein
MMKEMFGWLIAVMRRWAMGCSDENKTARAIYGISVLCGLYITGFILNSLMFSDTDIPKWLPSWIITLLVTIFILLPLIIPLTVLLTLLRTYPKEVVEIYIKKYEPRDVSHCIKQHLVALLFFILSFLVMHGKIVLI